MNKIFITGNVVETPVVKTTQSGINTTNFKVAVQRSFANKNGERESDFFTVVAWKKTADFCGRYLTKGRKVAIEGQMQNRNYTDKNNQKHYIWELIADNVEPCDRRESNGNNAIAPQQQNQQQSNSAPVEQEEANIDGNFEEVQDDDLPFE